MGDQDQRRARLFAGGEEKIGDAVRRRRIEARGRLVGDEQARGEEQGARDGDTLHLAARQQPEIAGVADTDAVEQRAPPARERSGHGEMREARGQQHVFERRQRREEMELLEDEPDMIAAPAVAGGFAEAGDVFAVPRDASRQRPLDSREDAGERGLAGTRRTLDRDTRASGNIEALDGEEVEPRAARQAIGDADVGRGERRPAARRHR